MHILSRMMKTVETLVAAREITAAFDAQNAPEKAAVENALRDLSADLHWARSELAKAHQADCCSPGEHRQFCQQGWSTWRPRGP